MNKQAIDKYIPMAYKVLEDTKIAKNGEINKTFRSYISSFGAAITMGSLRAAVAFFSKDGADSKEDKALLMKAVYKLIPKKDGINAPNLLAYICDQNINEAEVKEDILNAAIALKLAMNMYKLV